MPSERVQRQIDGLLDRCEEAIARRDWDAVLESVAAILVADPENADALTYRSMADRGREAAPPRSDQAAASRSASHRSPAAVPVPTSLCKGRYLVKRVRAER